MKKQVIIVGAGSVGKFLAFNQDSFCIDFEVIGFLDDDESMQNTNIAGIPVLGKVNDLPNYAKKGLSLAWGIAFPQVKATLFEKYKSLEFHYPPFIAKKAWISSEVEIGQGAIIYPGTSINFECNIGDFVVMNMNCAIGHNCTIGNFSSLAPGVNLGGYTQLGQKTDMGIGSATKQFITIGENCVVGGQAMVINHLADNQKVIGVPAK